MITWTQAADGRAWVTDKPLPADCPIKLATNGRISVVAASLPTWRALRAAGHEVPSLLDLHPWPGEQTPWSHQRVTAEFCLQHDRCAVLHDPGSGKTLSTIWAMLVLLRQGVIRRAVVVAPISIAGHVWERECRAAGLRVKNLCEMPPDDKREHFAGSWADVIILNPDGLSPVLRQLQQQTDLLVVDEATCFKNPTAVRSKLAQGVKAPRVWLLTGTPTPNGPMDALGLVKLLNPASPFGVGSWRDATMQQITKFRWRPKPEAAAMVAKHLAPALRYSREQCYDVPDVLIEYMEFDLSRAQKILLKKLRTEMRTEYFGQIISAPNAAALANKLLQIECGGVRVTDEKGQVTVTNVGAAAFFGRALQFVEESDTSVLVFAPHRSTVANLAAHFKAHGQPAVIVNGDTPTAQRMEIFDRVQRGQRTIVVAVPGTMSHGITLTEARMVLWAAPPTRAEEYTQANARIVRPGQKNKCVIAHLFGSPATKGLYKAMQDKTDVQDSILNIIRGT